MNGDEKLTKPADPIKIHTPSVDFSPIRAVLDTNILVSYALMDGRPPRHNHRQHDALRRCVERVRQDHGLLGSAQTLAELRATLLRPDFERYQRKAARVRFCEAIEAETQLVTDPPDLRLCRDPNDDMFLAVALAADADWLVTVDQQLLSVGRVGRAVILRPERFLERLG